MLKVSEVAKILNVSTVTIYKKLELFKKELKPYIKKNKKGTFIDNAGIEIIRNSIDKPASITTDDPEEIAITLDNTGIDAQIDLHQDYINSLKSEIDNLRNELNNRNSQINEQLELTRNFQVLLKDNNDKVKLLETKLEENNHDKKPFWNLLKIKRG